jgi:ferredoxin
VSRRLRVDWPACTARGLCHELLPEVVALDEWGYPLVTGPVTEELLGEARAAVRACPRLALRLVSDPPPARPGATTP